MSTVNQPINVDSRSEPNTGEVCIANISTSERRKRLTFGVISFVIALAILGALMASGTNRLWRLPLFLLFFSSTSGYFQWHDKTCVGLSRRNSRKLGDTMEKIEDAAELAQVKTQAQRVQNKALLSAIPLTLIALLLPMLG